MEDFESELKRIPLRRPSEQLDERIMELRAAASAGGPARVRRRALVLVVVLLGLVIGSGLYLYQLDHSSRTESDGRLSSMTNKELLRVLEREAMSARLVASAHMLSQQPECSRLARDTYRHVAEEYRDTRAGGRARRFLEED